MTLDTADSRDECDAPTRLASAVAVVLCPIALSDPALEYCLALARNNMLPYLERRGQTFDDARWRHLAPRADFFLIEDHIDTRPVTLGFLSVRDEADSPQALHIGDIQLESGVRNRGVGSAVLSLAEALARSCGRRELTLNVFRDNPAIHLYERVGFRKIDMQFDKYKMRKALPKI